MPALVLEANFAAVRALAAEARLALGALLPREVDELELALVEATTNLVHHANARVLSVEITVRDADVTLRITDDGRPWRPPETAAARGVDCERGRGWLLIRATIDAVEYSPGPPNVLTLRRIRSRDAQRVGQRPGDRQQSVEVRELKHR